MLDSAWRNLISGSAVGSYAPAGLNTEQTKVFSLSLTPPDIVSDVLCSVSPLSLAIQSETAGASWWRVRYRGKFMGSDFEEDLIHLYIGNITQMGRSMEEITRDTMDRTRWRRYYCGRYTDMHSKRKIRASKKRNRMPLSVYIKHNIMCTHCMRIFFWNFALR